MGYKTQVKQLSEYHDACGLEAKEGEEEQEAEEEDDEEDESGSETGSESEED